MIQLLPKPYSNYFPQSSEYGTFYAPDNSVKFFDFDNTLFETK